MNKTKRNLCASLADLRVNGLAHPAAVDTPQPVFSWRMESGRTGARQLAWRIRVREEAAVCWDSGRVEDGRSIGIEYPASAAALRPETDYRWDVSVWDETGAELTAGASFSTGLMGGGLESWHGAQWIGPGEISVAAYTVPVFRIQCTLQIGESGSRAGLIFGAHDPRLASSIQNNFLIHGENYILFSLNVSRIPASLEVYRKGYLPGETAPCLLEAVPVPAEILHEGNRYAAHSLEIAVSGCQAEYILVDGRKLETAEENRKIADSMLHPVKERTHLILNPLRKVEDTPVFPRLCEVGFYTDENTRATFTDYVIRHYGGEQNIFFGPRVGATYAVFSGCEGVAADPEGGILSVSPGTLAWADPSFGGLPMLRGEFEIRKPVRSAKIHAACRGIMEISVNGHRAGEEYLAPGDMDFRKCVYYETFDISELLVPGRNAVGAVLASGWYGDECTYSLDTYNFYGDRQALLALISVRYEDGTCETFPTDASWRCFLDGPARYAANFNGETWDATRESAVEGWDTPGFDAGHWPAARGMDETVRGCLPRITARPDAGITRVEELTAAYVGSRTRGSDQDTVWLYDMGVNMVGVPEITFPQGKPGRKVTIRYAEMLYPELPPDNPFCYGELAGLILTENLRGALVTDRYVMKGVPGETFRPRHTFHGYRYVEISGTDGPVPAENVRGIVLSSVRLTASYESSSPLANRLFANIGRSTLGNFLSIPTDCPQRDERLGWAGDAQVYSEAGTYMADARTFYPFFCALQREAQGPDGTFHLYAPSYAEIGVAFALGYTWNAAGVVIPWQTYLQYGDETVLRDNYPAIRAHALGMMDKKADGRRFLTNHIGFLGDHLSVRDTDPFLMDNAQFYRVMVCAQRIADILGEGGEAALFRDYAEGLKAEWNEVFVDAEGRTRSADGAPQDTQASYALPLMCGVFSAEHTPAASDHLAEACEKAGHTMTTGFMGTGPLLPALTEGGHTEEACRLFEQTSCPSWLYPVINGATTVWERWNSYSREQGFGGQNWMNSFNHYSLGAVASWMLAYQAGIQRGEKPGFRSFILQPVPGGHFTSVRASCQTVSGTIESGWTGQGETLRTYDATVPANTGATLYLPVPEDWAPGDTAPEGAAFLGIREHLQRRCAVYQLTSGSYHFDLARPEG